jgi:hypothetical protein
MNITCDILFNEPCGRGISVLYISHLQEQLHCEIIKHVDKHIYDYLVQKNQRCGFLVPQHKDEWFILLIRDIVL